MNDVDAQSVKSGARILDLIEHLAAKNRPASLAEVVAELRIPKSSALMLLRTLVAKHYVERDDRGHYQLDSIYRLSNEGWVGGQLSVLRKLARPFMQELAREVQETVVIGVLTPSFEVKIVEKVRSPREVRYDIELGAQYPAFCTSMGRAILGFMDSALVEHYLHTVPRSRCTPKTTIDANLLLDILSTVRRQGYAVNIEEHVDGASSVATALIGESGQILGAVNVGCVTANFLANRKQITTQLLSTAQRINAQLAKRSSSKTMDARSVTDNVQEQSAPSPLSSSKRRRAQSTPR